MVWLIVTIIGLLLLCIFTTSHGIPCDFADSISIDDGDLLSNKSILFNGIEYPADQYANFSYTHEDGTERVELRGCICNIRKCIRLCCPYGSFTTSIELEDVECQQNETARDFQANVLDENDRTNILNLDEHFGYVDRICKLHYAPDPEEFIFTHVRIEISTFKL